MISRDAITGVILCGGDARRMDGIEKALQLVRGIPMVQHVRERLSPQVGRIFVSANREHEQYRTLLPGDTLIADDVPDLGPLGGIMTALSNTDTPFLFCCPGDAPFLHDDLVSRLAAALHAQPAANAAVPFDGNRTQHLFLLLRTTNRERLRDYLDRGERSVHGFVAACEPVLVNATDFADSFLNINTATELAAASHATGTSVADIFPKQSQSTPPDASEQT